MLYFLLPSHHILNFFVLKVKEIGLMTRNCTCLAADMSKIFEAYWVLAQKSAVVPAVWPSSFNTNINKG